MEIPLGARILAVADCYDALRSDRPYRRKLDREMALQHLQAESGKSYDPAIVKQLVAHVDELEKHMQDSDTRLSTGGVSLEVQTNEPATLAQHRRGNTVFHEIASTHKEIQALYEISRVLGKSLKLSETLSLLADKIGNLVPYTSAAIFLLDSQEGKLVPYHTVGMHSDLLEDLELFVGDGITGWVAAHKQYLMNVSPAPDFGKAEVLHESFRNCLVMPLTLSDTIVGVISLYSTQAEEYHQDHLRFMETIADHAATAIRNAIIYEETQENAYTDLLTGLPNLRFFHVFMDRELKRAARLEQPLTLLMMDLENFKEVNDRFGHEVGNRLLVQIAQLLGDQLRDSDKCIRYAGDEFIAILPGLGKEQSVGAIERIQKNLDNYQFQVDDKETANIGISVGAASFPEDGRNPDLLLVVADQGMYRNKFERRNRQEYPAKVVPIEKNFEQSS